MHKTALKAAVERHGKKDLKPVDLLAAIQGDDKDFNEEEVNEIFEAIMADKHGSTQDSASKEGISAKETPAMTNAAASADGITRIVCDIWNGTWVGTKSMLNPMTGQRVNIAFRFQKNGEAKRKNVKVEPRRLEDLNRASHIHITGVVVEQVIPVDHQGDWTYERDIEDGIPR